MRLNRLVLRHFRNLRNQDLELPPEGVALIGDNAQGKSNFLEAIYYLETLRSFRGARDDQMVRFGEDVFRIVGTAEVEESGDGAPQAGQSTDRGPQTGGEMRGTAPDRDSEVSESREVEIAAAFQRRGRRKKVTLDGTEADRLTDALGRLSAVIFSPADLELVSGGPSERRRFLDIVLSLNETGYVQSLQDYRKILQRRNASLKAGAPPSQVAAWDPGLVRSGARIMSARARWIEEKCGAFAAYYRRVSDEARAVMTYRPDVGMPSEGEIEAIEEALGEALSDTRDRERRRGWTVVGPHRDDVRLWLEDDEAGVDLRDFGSGGQRRTAAFALRLVEAMTIREHRSRQPMVLLDDVFAELDPGRSERILDVIEGEEIGQVVLTAPKETDVRIRRDRLPRWRISGGEITT